MQLNYLVYRSIPDASRFYLSSSGYNDELIWAALWLYSATEQRKYLFLAQVNQLTTCIKQQK